MRDADRFDLVLREAVAAQGMTPEGRARHFETLARTDPFLAAAVAQHLRDLERTSSNDSMEGDALSDWVEAVDKDDPTKPERIGDYQVVGWLGGGGFGDVYRARPLPGLIAPEDVAIKLLKPGLHTPEILARFRREEKILAQLADDRIARLISGGNHEGLPYFVMEYVEGQSVTEYCDDRRFTTRERLALFGRICHAIQHAHDVGVVHCDLKPANILVTAAGVPKLLDFGIAKSLRGDPVDSDDVTGPLGRPLTAAYASPEQVTGEPITPRSEVYTLGVVLYELLTGRRPYDMPPLASQEQARRIILTSQPPRPSQTVGHDGDAERVIAVRDGTPARLRSRLKGEVDLIVMKAMRKEPGRRYQSVRDLADDIANHLEGRPVEAHPDSVGYRLRKTAANPWFFGPTAAVVCLSALTGWALTERSTALPSRVRRRTTRWRRRQRPSSRSTRPKRMPTPT